MSPLRSARLLGSILLGLGAVGVVVLCWTEVASASNVAAGLGEDRELTVPTWLTLLTGGVTVGASAMLAALVTDRQFVDAIHGWRWPLESARRDHCARGRPSNGSSPSGLARRAVTIGSSLGSLLGLATLAAVIIVGLEGPAMATANLAVVLAFVGLRALLPMIAVLVGNPWPAIDPFRTIAGVVTGVLTRVRGRGQENGTTEHATRTAMAWHPLAYPSWLSSWPAVLGLGALVFLELVLPVTTEPALLAIGAVCYTGYAITGAVLFSPAVWFRRGDPLAVLFRLYGAVGPIQRQDGQVRLVVPGSRLRETDVIADSSEVAFVVLLVWELTFNGFVVTQPGRQTVETLVATGIPASLAYLLLLSGGFGLTLALYWLAAHTSRRIAPTYLSERVLAWRFAPSLLAIAAGYHLAHYVTFVVSLTPASLAALSSPLAPPVNPTTLDVPAWMGTVEIGVLLAGHILAIWAAHAIAFDCVPGRLQAIRSQYPFVVVMVCYTVLSLWLLTLPTMEPLYVAG